MITFLHTILKDERMSRVYLGEDNVPILKDERRKTEKDKMCSL